MLEIFTWIRNIKSQWVLSQNLWEWAIASHGRVLVQFGCKCMQPTTESWVAAYSTTSVATVTTDVFQINQFSMRNEIGRIAKIFVKIEDPENRGVI